MMKPLSPHNRLSIKELVRRADRVADDLNVLLVVETGWATSWDQAH